MCLPNHCKWTAQNKQLIKILVLVLSRCHKIPHPLQWDGIIRFLSFFLRLSSFFWCRWNRILVLYGNELTAGSSFVFSRPALTHQRWPSTNVISICDALSFAKIHLSHRILGWPHCMVIGMCIKLWGFAFTPSISVEVITGLMIEAVFCNKLLSLWCIVSIIWFPGSDVVVKVWYYSGTLNWWVVWSDVVAIPWINEWIVIMSMNGVVW